MPLLLFGKQLADKGFGAVTGSGTVNLVKGFAEFRPTLADLQKGERVLVNMRMSAGNCNSWR